MSRGPMAAQRTSKVMLTNPTATLKEPCIWSQQAAGHEITLSSTMRAVAATVKGQQAV